MHGSLTADPRDPPPVQSHEGTVEQITHGGKTDDRRIHRLRTQGILHLDDIIKTFLTSWSDTRAAML
jgi:hypothetical protein